MYRNGWIVSLNIIFNLKSMNHRSRKIDSKWMSWVYQFIFLKNKLINKVNWTFSNITFVKKKAFKIWKIENVKCL